MGSLIQVSIKLSEFKKIDLSKIVKGEKDSYVPLTISVNDESRYGQNVSVFVQQSKEERDAKQDKHYVANGSVIWTDGTIKLAEKEGGNTQPQQSSSPSGSLDDDLPF
jgi:hypothetical protein